MIPRILLIAVCCLSVHPSFSLSDSTIVPKDLKSLVGCWKGSLTYLDYTSNKPFSMPANMVVKDFTNSGIIVYALAYPEEPSANSTDTLFISADGKSVNNEPVTGKTKTANHGLEIITEINSVDGNDHKPCIIRHTYTLGKNTYSIKKEVLFTGQEKWILRNIYSFTRAAGCN